MAFENKSCTIFVGNLPYDADEDDLKEIFSRAGPVVSLRLVFDKDTKQPKGYGFCDFDTPETAVKAIKELSDVECNGRRIRMDLADNALRGKGKGKDGGLMALGDAPGGRPPSQMAHTSSGASGRPGAAPGALPPGSLPPDLEAKLQAAKNEPSAEAIAAEVSAHTETASIVSSMPQVQLQLCLGAMQRLAEEAPESARALLTEHPQLCYALLQSQMLLGLDSEPLLPPNAEEVHQLKMQAAQGAGLLGHPGLHPRPMMPMMGMPGMAFPGMPAGMGGFQVPPMPPLAAIPRPPPAQFAKAPGKGFQPVPLQPGLVPSPMDLS